MLAPFLGGLKKLRAPRRPARHLMNHSGQSEMPKVNRWGNGSYVETKVAGWLHLLGLQPGDHSKLCLVSPFILL